MKCLPGVFHWYALDEPSGRLVHIHAHHQLLVGDDMTKNARLPIEDAYLAAAIDHPPFKIAGPTYEFGLLLIRMVLKHCPWDSILMLQGSLSASERRELVQLRAQVDPGTVWETMARQLPIVPSALWERMSTRSNRAPRSAPRHHRAKAAAGPHLVNRRRQPLDTYLEIWRRIRTLFRRKIFVGPVEKRIRSGGALIAIVGSDGAGKSTAVDDLQRWLGREITTTSMHMGKPPRGVSTRAVRRSIKAAAKVRRTPNPSGAQIRSTLQDAEDGSPVSLRDGTRLVWEVFTARALPRIPASAPVRDERRDRRCDRFPFPGHLDGRGRDGTSERPIPARSAVAALAAGSVVTTSGSRYPDVLDRAPGGSRPRGPAQGGRRTREPRAPSCRGDLEHRLERLTRPRGRGRPAQGRRAPPGPVPRLVEVVESRSMGVAPIDRKDPPKPRSRVLHRVLSDGSLTKKASLNAVAADVDQGARMLARLLVTPFLVTRARRYAVRGLAGTPQPDRSRGAGERPTGEALKWTVAHDSGPTDYERKRRQVATRSPSGSCSCRSCSRSVASLDVVRADLAESCRELRIDDRDRRGDPPFDAVLSSLVLPAPCPCSRGRTSGTSARAHGRPRVRRQGRPPGRGRVRAGWGSPGLALAVLTATTSCGAWCTSDHRTIAGALVRHRRPTRRGVRGFIRPQLVVPDLEPRETGRCSRATSSCSASPARRRS